MTAYVTYDDIGVTLDNLVATIEIQRPPHNFFDIALINQIADVLEKLDADDDCRASVLCAEGKAFCAGANFGGGEALDEKGQFKSQSEEDRVRHLYMEAVRLFECRKPIVGAIEGPAIGGGLGLAMVPDFRVTCSEARFAANFTRLGFHPGFGLTETLPAIVGQQNANLMFFTSRRFKGDEAYAMAWPMSWLQRRRCAPRRTFWLRKSPRTRRLAWTRPGLPCVRGWPTGSGPRPRGNLKFRNV